jgi:hypothetical protein
MIHVNNYYICLNTFVKGYLCVWEFFTQLRTHKTSWCAVKCNSFIDRNFSFWKLTIPVSNDNLKLCDVPHSQYIMSGTSLK